MTSTVIFDTLTSSLRSAAIEAAIEVDPNNLRVRDTFLERLMREKQEMHPQNAPWNFRAEAATELNIRPVHDPSN